MKLSQLPGRGTLLNFATVLVGALIGLALKQALKGHDDLMASAQLSLGIVTICFGLKMFLSSKNSVLVALAVALGGIIGTGIGINQMVGNGASMLQDQFGGTHDFKLGLISTSVLFCVGPMTFLGCIRDGIDRNIDLLKMKSTMDGIVAVFFAAAFGNGVVVTAFVVLIFQGLLTLLAVPLRRLAEDPDMVDEITGTGGPILVIVGVSLAGLKEIASADYLPALFLVPPLVLLFRAFQKKSDVVAQPN